MIIISFSRRKKMCTVKENYDRNTISGTRYRRALGKENCHLGREERAIFCVFALSF